jgi:hypothetical protein
MVLWGRAFVGLGSGASGTPEVRLRSSGVSGAPRFIGAVLWRRRHKRFKLASPCQSSRTTI